MFAEPIRILPLGDSITQGGRKVRAEYTYRFPPQKMLSNGHFDTEFIGSMSTGLDADFKWPDVEGKPFQLHHEGHYGWKTAAVRDHLADWMKTYKHPPDIVLIHLGTNDQDAAKKATDSDEKNKLYKQAITDPLSDIIKMLRKKKCCGGGAGWAFEFQRRSRFGDPSTCGSNGQGSVHGTIAGGYGSHLQGLAGKSQAA